VVTRILLYAAREILQDPAPVEVSKACDILSAGGHYRGTVCDGMILVGNNKQSSCKEDTYINLLVRCGDCRD
jgi:hypothetical protein